MKKTKIQICQTVVNDITGKVCGHPNTYHNSYFWACRKRTKGKYCPCKKFKAENEFVTKANPIWEHHKPQKHEPENDFKWTDWNCESCGIFKMLKKRESDGKLLCKKCSKNVSLAMAIKKPQKKGCGKVETLNLDYDNKQVVCGKSEYLCPSCSNHTPQGAVPTLKDDVHLKSEHNRLEEKEPDGSMAKSNSNVSFCFPSGSDFDLSFWKTSYPSKRWKEREEWAYPSKRWKEREEWAYPDFKVKTFIKKWIDSLLPDDKPIDCINKLKKLAGEKLR